MTKCPADPRTRSKGPMVAIASRGPAATIVAPSMTRPPSGIRVCAPSETTGSPSTRSRGTRLRRRRDDHPVQHPPERVVRLPQDLLLVHRGQPAVLHYDLPVDDGRVDAAPVGREHQM